MIELLVAGFFVCFGVWVSYLISILAKNLRGETDD